MGDFRMTDRDVSVLINGFGNIKEALNLKEADLDISKSSVGHDGIISSLRSFNEHVSRTKNKYRKKTESLIDFLKEAESGSDTLDQQLKDAITVSEGKSSAGAF